MTEQDHHAVVPTNADQVDPGAPYMFPEGPRFLRSVEGSCGGEVVAVALDAVVSPDGTRDLDPRAELEELRKEVALLRVALVHARTSDEPLPPALRPALARALLALRG